MEICILEKLILPKKIIFSKFEREKKVSFVILTLVIYKIKENYISKFKIKKYKLLFVIIISRSFTIINWFKTIQVHRSKYRCEFPSILLEITI